MNVGQYLGVAQVRVVEKVTLQDSISLVSVSTSQRASESESMSESESRVV